VTGDCVEWGGTVNNTGYGIVFVRTPTGIRTTTTATRFLWAQAHGPIPDGLQIDHLCRNRRCVNLDHLELVTRLENVRRAPWTQITHCLRGHPFEGDNLVIQMSRRGTPMRKCRTCDKIRRAEYQARRRAS